MRALKGLRGGRIDLVTMPSPGMEPLTTILTTFSRAHPECDRERRGRLHPRRSPRIGANRIRRDRHPRIRQNPPKQPTSTSIPLERQALVLISGPDDDGPTDDSISRDDLTGCRLIVSQRGSLMRALVDDVLASGIEVSIVAEIAHRTSILPMVLNGLGRAVMPASWTAISPPLRRPGPNHHTRDLPARRRRQPTHPPHHTRHRTHDRSPGLRIASRPPCIGPARRSFSRSAWPRPAAASAPRPRRPCRRGSGAPPEGSARQPSVAPRHRRRRTPGTPVPGS